MNRTFPIFNIQLSSRNFRFTTSVLWLLIISTSCIAQHETLIPYRKDTQWGFATPDKKIFIVPQHDEVFPFNNGYARVRNGTRYGIIDLKGRIIVPIAFDDVSDISEGKFVAKQGTFPASLCGYYDTTGKAVIPFRFVDAFPFHNGRAMVKVGKFPNLKDVFINHEGKMAAQIYTATKYDMIGTESEGLIRFRENGKWGYMNSDKTIFIAPTYQEAGDFIDGLAYVKQKGKFGYIDKNKKTVVPFKYDMAGDFYKGVAIVYVLAKTNDEFQSEVPRYGLIEKSGKEITPLQYDFIGMFSKTENVAVVKKGGKQSFIDLSGKEIMPFKYDFISEFHEGVAVVRSLVNNRALSGIIDISGKEIVPLSEIKFTTFSEGLIAFEKNKKVGFMNTKGEIVIPAKYDAYIWKNFDRSTGTSEFKNGICGVIKEGNLVYINTKGEEFYEE
jgi:hypothetical protein